MSATCPHCGRDIWLTRPSFSQNGGNLEELGLSVRSYNCLQRVGIYTIWDLENHDDKELGGIPNFGRKSLAEVKDALGKWKVQQRRES